MNDAVFVDTNILVYARDAGQPIKQPLAARFVQQLWQQRAGRISMQVLNEYYVTVTRKLKRTMDRDDAWDDIQALLTWNPQPLDREILLSARDIESRYRTCWWDALIVAAARAQNCRTLLSEDLRHGMVFFGRLTVRNPFLATVEEPEIGYPIKPRERHRARGRPAKVR